MIHAFAADVFVTMILRPRLLRVLHLPGHALTAHIGQQPRQASDKTFPASTQTPIQNPTGLSSIRASKVNALYRPMKRRFEKIRFPFGTKDSVVQFDGLRKQFLVGDNDVSLCHLKNDLRSAEREYI